jgi:hypothetical protein
VTPFSPADGREFDCLVSMILLRRLTGVLIWVLLGMAALPAVPQVTTAVEVTRTDRIGQVLTTDEKLTTDGFWAVAARPEPADLRKLPPEIRERLRRFEVVREAYLKEQEELRKKLRGAATDAERDRVRELMRQTRQEWLDRARQLREESLRRLRELPSVVPDMREVLSNARENARDAANEVRKRRGQD